jgi:hypothetical protein
MSVDFYKLEDSPHLLDLLIQMEDVLDSMDVYVYKNWFKGEVINGPIIRRHWLSMELLYPYDKMPDPRASLRLIKHGVKVAFSKFTRKASASKDGPTDVKESVDGDDKDEKLDVFWLVRLDFPKRLIGQMDAVENEFYDEDIDVDDAQDAVDAGLDDESAYRSDQAIGSETSPDGGGDPAMMGMPPEGPPA